MPPSFKINVDDSSCGKSAAYSKPWELTVCRYAYVVDAEILAVAGGYYYERIVDEMHGDR